MTAMRREIATSSGADPRCVRIGAKPPAGAAQLGSGGSSPPNGANPSITLADFHVEFAHAVAEWVRSESELRLLAPGTPPPLTAEKVLAWRKPRGIALAGSIGHLPATVLAYGELNEVDLFPGRFWLGHVIVAPEFRGRGWGRRFVQSLVDRAFKVCRASRIELIVFPENESAIQCYRSAGFRLVGSETHRFREDGLEERMLRLELTRQRFLAVCGVSGHQREALLPVELSGSTAMAAKTPSTKPDRICDTPL